MLAPVPPAHEQLRDWRQALRLIRSNNTTLRSARAQIDVAQGQARQALANALPQLTGNAQIQRHILRGRGFDPFTQRLSTLLPDPATTWNAGATLRIPVLASKAWYDHGTAKDQIEATRLQAKDAERAAVSQVALAIISVVTAERLAEVTRVNLRSALSMLELNRRRARLGSASAVDVLRMEQEVASSKAQLLSADEAVRRAREALGLALGTPSPWGVSPNISLNQLAEDARTSCQTENSLDSRYDIRAAEAKVQIAKRNVNSVDHLFVPTIDAVSTVTYWDDELRTANRQHVTWTIGGLLTWNIYDGGLRYGIRDTNQGLLRVAEDTVTDRKRAARVEVDRAVRNIEVAKAQLEVATKTAEITRQSAKFAQITFLNGTGTSFDMVDTARNQRQAEIDVAIKEFELLQAKITAFLAMASCSV